MDPQQWAAQPKTSMPAERSVSFLKVPGAEQIPIGQLLAFLVGIMITIGADGALFPNISKALERTVDFDMSTFAQLQTTQGFTQAILGPIWGVLCARGYFERKTLLAFLTFAQGLATVVMAFYIKDLNMMLFLRVLNGACLSGMMPITFSIIADRFDDEVRGRMCALMNMCKGVGDATFGFFYGFTAEWCAAQSRWQACNVSDSCNEGGTCTCTGLLGWQYAFIITGVVTMAFAPFVYAFMKAPEVIVKDVPKDGGNIIVSELKALGAILYSTPTFLILVIQGCFGALPANAMFLRSFFFQTIGISAEQATTIQSAVSYVAIFGTGFSGWLSDFLTTKCPLHGRIFNAEFSVYTGVPICFVTFFPAFYPDQEDAFVWFFTLCFLLALVQGGVQGGTNVPILSQLAEPDDRALIIAWQSALEGAVSTFGPVLMTTLTAAFGYRRECESPCTAPGDCDELQNGYAAGTALLYCTCIPWGMCGLMYSCLHYFYPRDMNRIFEERRARNEGAGALSTELTNS